LIEDNADQADTSTQKQDTHENFTEELESEAEEPSLQVGGQELVGATEEEDALYVASEFSPRTCLYISCSRWKPARSSGTSSRLLTR